MQRQRQRQRAAGAAASGAGISTAGRRSGRRRPRYSRWSRRRRSCGRRHRRCRASAIDAPHAERNGIDHRADLVARSPNAPLRSAVSVDVRAWYRASRTRATRRSATRSATHGQSQTLPVFIAVMTAAIGRDRRAGKQRARILEQRIDQRRAKSTATSSDRLLRLTGKLHVTARASCLDA